MAVELTITPASDTWRQVVTTFTRVNAVLAREMADETKVSIEWYGILLMLAQAGDGVMRPSDIADLLGRSRSATTRLVDRLEADGLVERKACGSDRRGTFIGLTTKGERTFRRAGRVHLRGIDRHVGSHLSPAELAELGRLLMKLSDGVGGDSLAGVTAENQHL
jgi:DNA-binding MarR family transcriptional regulator